MEPFYEEDPLNAIAKENFGIPGIYPYQRLAIINVLEAVDNRIQACKSETEEPEEYQSDQIVLLPTGSGKSLCYLLPAYFLQGITLVVFPILSLISDQMRRCAECKLPAAALRGGMSEEERSTFNEECLSGRIRIILTNPEMLTIPETRGFLAGLPIHHLVIDEAHTVPEWGESFRPSCLELIVALRHIHPAAVSAFTATASPDILSRIRYHLFPMGNPRVICGNPDRANIRYGAREVLSPKAALTYYAEKMTKPLIVFCRTRKGTERTALLLKKKLPAHPVRFYHAGLTRAEKEVVEKWFFGSSDGILTATCAYGLGVDKPDIRSVIHLGPPPSPEAYLQESGRAGRDGLNAEALLLLPATTQEVDDATDSEKRLNRLIRYARNTHRCRRVELLAFLDYRGDDCSGCDVCDGTAVSGPEEEPLFNHMLKLRNRYFPPHEAVKLLKGIFSTFLKARDWNRSAWFGALSCWDMEDISEALKGGIETGRWKVIRFGPGKGNLALCRTRKKRVSSPEDTPFWVSSNQQNVFLR